MHVFLNRYLLSAIIVELFISRFQVYMTNQEIPVIHISNIICLDICDIIL